MNLIVTLDLGSPFLPNNCTLYPFLSEVRNNSVNEASCDAYLNFISLIDVKVKGFPE
jgi:hypothetical protein